MKGAGAKATGTEAARMTRVVKKMAGLVAILGVAVARVAAAGDGYVTGDVELRAGPDPGYPTVVRVNAGTPISIQGCVKNWSWCDVVTANGRGWVPGDFLEEDYQGHRAVVPAFGVQMGIPIVTFSFDKYWTSHYHNRPWFAERTRWAKVKPRYTPPMRRPIDPKAGDPKTGEPKFGQKANAPAAQRSGNAVKSPAKGSEVTPAPGAKPPPPKPEAHGEKTAGSESEKHER